MPKPEHNTLIDPVSDQLLNSLVHIADLGCDGRATEAESRLLVGVLPGLLRELQHHRAALASAKWCGRQSDTRQAMLDNPNIFQLYPARPDGAAS